MWIYFVRGINKLGGSVISCPHGSSHPDASSYNWFLFLGLHFIRHGCSHCSGNVTALWLLLLPVRQSVRLSVCLGSGSILLQKVARKPAGLCFMLCQHTQTIWCWNQNMLTVRMCSVRRPSNVTSQKKSICKTWQDEEQSTRDNTSENTTNTVFDSPQTLMLTRPEVLKSLLCEFVQSTTLLPFCATNQHVINKQKIFAVCFWVSTAKLCLQMIQTCWNMIGQKLDHRTQHGPQTGSGCGQLWRTQTKNTPKVRSLCWSKRPAETLLVLTAPPTGELTDFSRLHTCGLVLTRTSRGRFQGMTWFSSCSTLFHTGSSWLPLSHTRHSALVPSPPSWEFF